jgi:signal transduction histidine kinase
LPPLGGSVTIGRTPSRCEVTIGRLTPRAVLSRTLVWGALASCIVGVYLGVVAGLGRLLIRSPLSSPWLAITATVVVAVAFDPLRRRLERGVSRLVYGRRGSPYDVLASFTRQATTIEAGVLEQVARLLAEAMGAREAAVWVRTDGQMTRAAAWPSGEDRPAPVAVTDIDRLEDSGPVWRIIHDGELLGLLSLVTAPHRESHPSDERLLEQLSSALGLALRNAQLGERLGQQVEELRRSRRRVVELQDQTRQRLERDLHDGIQQRLVAMRVKLEIAKMRAGAGRGRLRPIIERLSADTDRAIESVRDFARGIYPPLLEARGLEAALAAQIPRQPIPVTLEAADVGRHARSVEAAVYFLVLEALQEAVTRARATSARVTLRADQDAVNFEISDDGRTSTDTAGLMAATADRLDALDAKLETGISVEGWRSVRGAIASHRVDR